MKIAVVGPTFPIRGGISHYTTLLVRNLRVRHEVLSISYSSQYPGWLFPGRSQLDTSGQPIDTGGERLISYANLLSWRGAARRIARFKPDMVVFSWVNPALAVQFRSISGSLKRLLPNVKTVFWCHNVTSHESLPFQNALTKMAFGRVDHFIVPGADSRADLLELMPGADVTIAPLPVLDAFTPPLPRKEARERLGVDPNADVALYFGFVRSYKGLAHLLRAMPEAVEKVPGLHLLVVGEFWEDRAKYDAMINDLGISRQVTVVDRYVANEEVALYFCGADIVVLPYVSATGSGVVQIAFNYGRPVIVTSVGSLPEVVEDGRTGLLVPPGDPTAIADAIAGFFNSPEGYSRNVADASSRFSWDRFVEMLEALQR
jgi:glycosyltransferase involved in cell wall biosynthesis